MNSAAVSSSAASLPLPTRWEWDGVHLILRNGHQAATGKMYDLRLSIWQGGAKPGVGQPLSLKDRAIPQTADVRVQRLFNAVIKQIPVPAEKVRFSCPLSDSSSLKSCIAFAGTQSVDMTQEKITHLEKEEASAVFANPPKEPTFLNAMQGIYDAVFPQQFVSDSYVAPINKEPPQVAAPALTESSPSDQVETDSVLSVSASPHESSMEDEEESEEVVNIKSPSSASVDDPVAVSPHRKSSSPLQIEEVEESRPSTPAVSIDIQPTAPIKKYSLPVNWMHLPHSVLYAFQEVSYRLPKHSKGPDWLKTLQYADLQEWKKDWPSSATPDVVKKAEAAILCLQREGFKTEDPDAIAMREWLKQLYEAGVSHLLTDKAEEMEENRQKYCPDLKIEQYVKRRVAADLILNLKIFIGSRRNLDRFIHELSNS